jgi:hypothetical protein
MARDDMSASDEPVKGISNRPFAPALDAPFAAAHVIHSIRGRVRLRVPTLKAGSQLGRGLEALLSIQPGVTEAAVNTGCRSVTVVHEPEVWTSESLCMFLQSRSREELEQYASLALADDAAKQLPMNWLQPWRFLNTTEGGAGSKGAVQTGEPVKSGYWKLGYASMIVGAILVPVPLVPGIPFLILSSYCFAKATVLKDEDGPEAEEQVPKAKE